MTSEERRAKARERVKKWKEDHKKSVIWQKERWYAKRKEKKVDVMPAKPIALVQPIKREVREVQETYYTSSMDEVEADPRVMAEQAARMEKYRPLVAPARKGPEERVVVHKASENEMKAMEDLVRLVERKKVDRPVGDSTSGTEVEME